MTPASPAWAQLLPLFPEYPGARAIIRAKITRISDSCGYGVPKFEYVEERNTLEKWAQNKGSEGLPLYRSRKNACSIDGLPGLEPELPL